jgi:hypothetical protein
MLHITGEINHILTPAGQKRSSYNTSDGQPVHVLQQHVVTTHTRMKDGR